MTLRDQLGRVRWRKGKGFLQGDLITRGRNRTSSWVASLPMQSVLSNLPPWSHDWARPRRNTKSTTDATKKKKLSKIISIKTKKITQPWSGILFYRKPGKEPQYSEQREGELLWLQRGWGVLDISGSQRLPILLDVFLLFPLYSGSGRLL